LVNCPNDSSINEKEDLSTKYKIVSQLELQKIATSPKLFPYNDMIGWVLDHVDIPTKTIFNLQKVAIGSFRPEHLQVMYKLSPVSNFVYNANFLVDFNKKECDQYGKNLLDLIKDWYSCPEKFREDSHGIYLVVALEPHIMYIEMMICRLYGKENTAHLFLPWVPIIHTIVEGYSFDWEKILSDSLVQETTRYQSLRAKGKPAQFFMSTYIMDVVCFMTSFPLMDWTWTPNSVEPIHAIAGKPRTDYTRVLKYTQS
jgi:hypothetical protein